MERAREARVARVPHTSEPSERYLRWKFTVTGTRDDASARVHETMRAVIGTVSRGRGRCIGARSVRVPRGMVPGSRPGRRHRVNTGRKGIYLATFRPRAEETRLNRPKVLLFVPLRRQVQCVHDVPVPR